jgi:Tol biopolymer transport system component
MNTISTTKTNIVGNGESSQPALDKTGQFSVFASDATNLSTDTSGLSAIYLKNTQTGDLKTISNDKYGIAANTASLNPTISGDGRYVIFESTAVVSTDFNGSILFPSFSDFDSRSQSNKGGVNNLFLKNTQTNDLTLVTSSFGDGDSVKAEITSDGKSVVFQSLASNFISNDSNGAFDIYVEDLQTKTLKLVSSDASGIIGNRASVNPSVSADGLKVAFASDADNFLGFNNVTMNLKATPWLPIASETKNINVSVPVDNNANRDVFVKNVSTGAIQLVSQNYKGGAANGVSDSPSINADGTKVVFRSFATNLISNLIDAVRDGSSYVYLKDLQTNTLTQIDLLNDNKLPNGSSYNPVISPDGKYVAFISDATSLVANDNNGVADVFLKNLATGELTKISEDSTGTGNVVDFAFSGDSSTLAFSRLSGLEDNATTNVYTTKIQAATVLNNPPTGNVTISGTTTQGQTLTASNSLADTDGLGAISYQWLSGGNVISGATQSTYALTAMDVGKAISVKASYTDLLGTAESVTSGKTALVIGTQSTVTLTGSIKTLVSNRVLTVSDNNVAVIGGAAGNETIRIQSGVSNTMLDANIERIELSGSLSAYKFVYVAGTGIQIFDASNLKIATMPSLNQDMKIAFSNGTAILKQTGASDFQLGGSAISSGTATRPSNVVIDTTDLSTLGAGSTTISSTNLIGNGTAGVDTFNIASGTYNATINGFAAGDKLSFFAGASITVVPDTNQTDGIQQLTAIDAGTSATTTITLTGLTETQDTGVFNVASFNTIFGAETIA